KERHQLFMGNCADVAPTHCCSTIIMTCSRQNRSICGFRLLLSRRCGMASCMLVGWQTTKARLLRGYRQFVRCVLCLGSYRSLYVGLSRARKRLVVHISRPSRRNTRRCSRPMAVCGKVQVLTKLTVQF